MKKLFKVSVSKVYVMYLLILTVFVVGTYSSYAYFTVNKEKKNAIKMITGNLIGELKVDGETNDKLVVPANTSKSFTIELINKNNRSARFNFYYKGSLKEGVEVGYIQNDGYNTMPSEKGVNLEANGTLGYYQKYRIKVKNNTSDSITIPIGYSVGLDYNDLSLPNDGHLFGEMKMNSNEPKLASNMIPVRYDGTNWIKADKDNWYNYEKGEWANAVTVSSDVRDSYLKASTGTTIEIDKIDTMWVWIPRYSYTIGSEDGTNYFGKK